MNGKGNMIGDQIDRAPTRDHEAAATVVAPTGRDREIEVEQVAGKKEQLEETIIAPGIGERLCYPARGRGSRLLLLKVACVVPTAGAAGIMGEDRSGASTMSAIMTVKSRLAMNVRMQAL